MIIFNAVHLISLNSTCVYRNEDSSAIIPIVCIDAEGITDVLISFSQYFE